MRNAIISIILAPIAIYVSLMGYLWLEVKNNTDELIASASPFAHVDYDSIHISPLGDEIGLNDISIQPNMFTDNYKIDQIRLSVPHIGYFLDTRNSLQSKELPEKLAVSINRLHVDLNGELFSMLDQAQRSGNTNEEDGVTEFVASIDALGCVNSSMFSIQDYRNMGMGVSVINLAMSIEHNKTTRRGTIQLNGGMEGNYDLDARVELDTRQGSMRAIQSKVPPKSTITYSDNGFHRLRNDYCAEINGISVDQYVENHIGLLPNKLGGKFTPEVIDTYRDYMLNGGKITVKFSPDDEVDMEQVRHYSPEDIALILGLNVAINGNEVNLKEIEWKERKQDEPDEKSRQVMDHTLSRADVSAIARDPETNPVRSLLNEEFNEINPTEAGNYINRLAEVSTADGGIRRGVISRVSNSHIYLVIRVSAGSLTYPVEFKLIEKLRVAQ